MVMTDDEYVETSDAEERGILWVQRPDFKVKHETPTKRRKLRHLSEGSKTRRPPFPSGSSPSVVSLPASSKAKYNGLRIIESRLAQGEFEPDENVRGPAHTFGEINDCIQDSVPADELFQPSQEDELDFLPRRQVNPHITTSNQTYPSPPMRSHLFTNSQTDVKERLGGSRASSRESSFEPLTQRDGSSLPATPLRSSTPMTDVATSEGMSSPIIQQRVLNSHPEFLQGSSTTPLDNVDLTPPAVLGADFTEELPLRRYSLRTREARQLNPYSIENLMYKQQMRGNPDAIVRVVSPHRAHGERPRSEHRLHDEDYIVPDGETQNSPEHHRRHERRTQLLAGSIDLSSIFDMSDEEDSLRLQMPQSPKRIRQRKHRFPMQSDKSSTDLVHEFTLPVRAEGISYKRRERRQKDGTVGKPGPEKKVPSGASQRGSSPEFTPDGDASSLNARAEEIFAPTMDVEDYGDNSRFEEPREFSPVRRQSSDHSQGRFSSPGSHDRMGNNSEEEEIDKKQLKALSRVMPKFMINRLLKKQGQRERQRPSKSVSASPPPASSGTEGDDFRKFDSNPIPGKSRIRKGGAPVEARPVKGDLESSDDGGADQPINVDTEDDDDSSDSSRDSVIEILDGLADRPPRQRRSPGPRVESSLIDRMLSRTSDGHSRGEKRRAKLHRLDVNSRKPKNIHLDIRVGVSRSAPRPTTGHLDDSEQTKLPFRRIGDPDVRPEPKGPRVIDVDFAESDFLAPAKLSKRERREAARRAGVHTFAGSSDAVTSGKKKGFMRVQIDMADSDLRGALKPLNVNVPSIAQQRHSEPRDQRRTVKRLVGHQRLGPSDAQLKQSSLLDFTYPLDSGNDTSEYVAMPQYGTEFEVRESDPYRSKFADCSIDFGMRPPVAGRMFGSSSYIGAQFLFEFLNVLNDVPVKVPLAYNGFDFINLHADMTAEDTTQALEQAHNLLVDWLDDDETHVDEGAHVLAYERMMMSLCHTTSWVLFATPNDEDRLKIDRSVHSSANRLFEKLQRWFEESSESRDRFNHRALSALWFAMEISARSCLQIMRAQLRADCAIWKKLVVLQLRCLFTFGIDKAVEAASGDLAENTVARRAASMWVGLIHAVPLMTPLPVDTSTSDNILWSILLELVKTGEMVLGSDVELNEQLWKLIFSLSALSHFSPRGVCTSVPHLPVCWRFVAFALDTIRLTEEPTKDAALSKASLRKRDKYVRIIVARCFLLVTRWKWPLRNSHPMVRRLVEVFKSRSFGNLLCEKPDFPAFLRHYDLSLIDNLDRGDTAFSLFLKFVVHAVRSNSGTVESERREKSQITKVLSLAIPISSVPFSKEQPPVGEQLSQLINRYSVIMAAILLEPTPINLKIRLDRAQKYLDFGSADDGSRAICIRAIMYTTVLANHLSLPLDDPLHWLNDVGETLLEEFRSIHKQMQGKIGVERHGLEASLRRIRTTIQLLVGCVRNIIERPQFEVSQHAVIKPRYPDVRLIKGVWIRKVLSMKDLTNDTDTRHQILLAVSSFLDARLKVIGPSNRPSTEVQEDSSESQDLYGDIELDDEVLAALAQSELLVTDEGQLERRRIKELDVEVARSMNEEIVPSIFRLLLQYFHEFAVNQLDKVASDRFWFNAAEWISCWVGCASVVVRNGLRTWGHYMNVGPQSWNGISDSFFRRKVALRFMYRVLICDPAAYREEQRTFFQVFLEALVPFDVTMEHDYMSLLLSIDGLKNPFLTGLPVHRETDKDDFRISKSQFLSSRKDIIDAITRNVDDAIAKSTEGGGSLATSSAVEGLVVMLSSMQDIWKGLSEKDRESYVDLCRSVFASIDGCSRVRGLPRLAAYIAWFMTLKQ